MNEEGWWQRAGTGYGPKYKSTVWALILLAQLGAKVKEDKRIRLACKYCSTRPFEGGQISAMTNKAPSGTIDCLQGNMLWSLMELGYDDPRLMDCLRVDGAHDHRRRRCPMKDKHAEVRYYAGKCGPSFACGANNKLPCAWGGVKVMLALGQVPVRRERRSSNGRSNKAWTSSSAWTRPRQSIPTAGRQNRAATGGSSASLFSTSPIFCRSPKRWSRWDSVMTRALKNTLELIRSKQDDEGRWQLEYNYDGKTWMRFGKMKEPNEWVTLRALKVLRAEFLDNAGSLKP
jgi:hypothetical protein